MHFRAALLDPPTNCRIIDSQEVKGNDSEAQQGCDGVRIRPLKSKRLDVFMVCPAKQRLFINILLKL